LVQDFWQISNETANEWLFVSRIKWFIWRSIENSWKTLTAYSSVFHLKINNNDKLNWIENPKGDLMKKIFLNNIMKLVNTLAIATISVFRLQKYNRFLTQFKIAGFYFFDFSLIPNCVWSLNYIKKLTVQSIKIRYTFGMQLRFWLVVMKSTLPQIRFSRIFFFFSVKLCFFVVCMCAIDVFVMWFWNQST
jgi:hypothetical protein